MTGTPWSRDMDDQLRQMWAKHHSLREIGRAVGRSKSAVAGRALRLGLKRHETPAPAVLKGTGLFGTKHEQLLLSNPEGELSGSPPAAQEEDETKGDPDDGARGLLGDIARYVPQAMHPSFAACQFIEATPEADDACKCGAATLAGSPYCARHHARCYVLSDAAEGAK